MDTMIPKTAGPVLFGKTRRSILQLLFCQPGEEFYLRQIERICGTGRGAVQRELANLLEGGLINRRHQGRMTLYSANKDCGVFEELRDLLLKTTTYPHQKTATRNISLPRKPLDALCRKYRISFLALYGSVLGTDFRAESDIDVLVDFEPGHVPGLAFFTLQSELTKLLGRKVDLHTPADLNSRFRDRVLAEAEVYYG